MNSLALVQDPHYDTSPRQGSKRDFERVKCSTALTLVYQGGQKELEGLCCDISENGLGIVTDRPLAIGAQCMVIIHDGRTNKSRYQARIEISRVSAVNRGGEDLFILGATLLQRF